MKTILSLFKPALCVLITLAALSASAGVTNITAKLTTEIAGVGTNSVNIKFQQDGSAKDALTVDSLVWYYSYALTNGMTTNDFTGWLKDTTKAALQSHNAERTIAKNAVRKQKLDDLLTTQGDALNAGDLSSIDAIIAKWTAP